MMWRKYHRIVALVVALPFALVLITGLMLQIRGQVEVIQPKPVKMTRLHGEDLLNFNQIMSASGVSEGEIEQIIFRPGKFHLALRLKNGNEVQVHPQTGKILKTAPRWTTFLIDLHQGSFLSPWGQYLIFLPAGVGVLFLLISGLVIYPWRKFRG